MKHRHRLVALVVAGATAAGVVPMVAAVARAHEPVRCDWNGFGNGPANAGATGCSTIGVANVAALAPGLLYRTRDSVTATPTVVDGRLYVGDWTGTFYAFDADAVGVGDPTLGSVGDDLGLGLGLVEPLWAYDTTDDDRNDVSFGRIVSSAMVGGVAAPDLPGGELDVVVVGAGASVFVFEADDDGGLVAHLCLDPRTEADAQADQVAEGLPVAGRCGGSEPEIEIESSPTLTSLDNGDLLITVGMDVHNAFDVGRAGIVQLKLKREGVPHGQGGGNPHWLLEPTWKFDPEGIGEPDGLDGAYTETGVGGDPLTYKSHTGQGCAGVWGTPAVDEAAGLVVFGTSSCKAGDADPGGTHEVVGESVFAVDLHDGTLLWRYDPPRPWGTRTDDDFGASAQLFEADVDGDGTREPLAGIGGKDGWYYALPRARDLGGADRLVGEDDLAWSSHLGQSGHANEDFAIGGIIGTPAVGEATVLDPVAGPVTRPVIYATTAISTPVGAPLDYGTPQSIDTSLAEDPARMLSLHAVDATSGRVIWRQPLHRQSYGHPTFVAGAGDQPGVVLVASTAGFAVNAFEATTGALLAMRPVNGAPSSGVAVTAEAAFVGAGTRQTDAGYKVFLDDSIFGDAIGQDPQERLAGIWGFRLPGG